MYLESCVQIYVDKDLVLVRNLISLGLWRFNTLLARSHETYQFLFKDIET